MGTPRTSPGVRARTAIAAALLVAAGSQARADLVNEATTLATNDRIANTATVSAVTLDPYPTSNVASVSVQRSARAAVTSTVVSSADLSLAKTASPGPYAGGSTITYTLVVGNGGPSSAIDVAVSDPLPAGVGFLAATPSTGGLCTTPAVGAGGTVACTWAGTTLPGETRTVTISVQAAPVASPTVIQNTATASSATSDPVPTNDGATAAVTVSGSVVTVPALGTPARVLLASLLALAGLVFARRFAAGG